MKTALLSVYNKEGIELMTKMTKFKKMTKI
jgi:hypothetical protein